jgi:hypothetical protein
MDSQPDVKSLFERIERLERQNRWIKRMGTVAVLSVAVLLVSGQAKVDTKKIVEANEFVLKDTNGAVRARLGMGLVFTMKNGPSLVLYDGDGVQQRVWVATSEGQAQINLTSSGPLTSFTTSSMWAGVPEKDRNGTAHLGDGSGVAITGPAGVVRMSLDGPLVGGPQIGLQDKQGYETDIGKTDLVFTNSGKKQQTSTASVVMFDRDKKVLWSAP